MARREKKETGGGGGWIVTFSDLMTLLLTFFVLLLSMSSMDERKVEAVIESLGIKFSTDSLAIPTLPEPNPGSNEPGAMDQQPNDMSPLRDMVSEDASQNLNFLQRRYLQTFSIRSEALFKPGVAEITSSGAALLNRLLPTLSQLDYPLLIVGHSSPRPGEKSAVIPPEEDLAAEAAWVISGLRALAVYRYFIDQGIDYKKLAVEAVGSFRPRYSQNTADGRAGNCRVDLVLDQRNRNWREKTDQARQEETTDNSMPYLRLPGEPPSTPVIPSGWRRR